MRLWRKSKNLFAALPRRWHVIALTPLTRPVHPGLWFTNVWFQRIPGTNSDAKRVVHLVGRVVSVDKSEQGEGAQPALSFAKNGNCYLHTKNGIVTGSGTMFGLGVKLGYDCGVGAGTVGTKSFPVGFVLTVMAAGVMRSIEETEEAPS